MNLNNLEVGKYEAVNDTLNKYRFELSLTADLTSGTKCQVGVDNVAHETKRLTWVYTGDQYGYDGPSEILKDIIALSPEGIKYDCFRLEDTDNKYLFFDLLDPSSNLNGTLTLTNVTEEETDFYCYVHFPRDTTLMVDDVAFNEIVSPQVHDAKYLAFDNSYAFKGGSKKFKRAVFRVQKKETTLTFAPSSSNDSFHAFLFVVLTFLVFFTLGVLF